MKKCLPLFLVLTFCPALSAQTVPPALMVKVEDKSQPLGLSRVETQVRIFGYVAQTTTTMTFYNPMDRVMEGDLYFPLPEGATISGYALDIEGRMVDGVAVEKHKGREVFEKIVRQGIDPGLIEWTKGNNFRTRVFPIPARGTRTIRVSYVTDLIGAKREPTYYLPLNFKSNLREFSLRVEVVKPEAAPRIEKGKLANFTFEKWQESFIAETRLQDVALTEDLVIALPEVERQKVLVETADDGQVYFAIHDFPKAPDRNEALEPPKHVVIFWDASGSRAGGDHEREIGLLEAYFKKVAGSGDAPSVAVDLILLRNTQSAPKRLVLRQANPAPLVAELKKVQYDGGTQIGALAPQPGADKPDFYMLFTDGISNFGREEPQGLDAPLYIFSADATTDHAFLRQLAITTGGRYFNLKRTPDSGVVPAIGHPAYCFLSAGAEGGAVEEIYPQLPQPVAGRFTLVGKLAGQKAKVTLEYGYPGQPAEKERSFIVSRDDAVEGSLLGRLWAQTRLADLVVMQKRNENEIVRLGKEYGLVTPFTSLIVLDSLEQYVEHEIAPPKSLPKVREQYMQQIDTLEHQNRKKKSDKLQAVLTMWRDRVKWWNTEFKYPKDFKYQEEKAAPGAEPGRPGAIERAPAQAPTQSLRMMPSFGIHLALEAPSDEGREAEAGGRQPGIVIKPWDPKTPYMKELKAADRKDAFAVYMKNRAEYGTSPAFFLDCGDHFFDKNDAKLALQVLSNIAELELESAALLRVLGHRLAQRGYLDLAILTFEEVLRLRPEEPQSYRDLALVLALRADQAQGRTSTRRLRREAGRRTEPSARDDYARAVQLLNEVLLGEWDGRFAEIEVVALMELNGILPKAKAVGLQKIPVDKRLRKLLDVDVRIVMTWDADNTDIDLWVIEPSGEKAFYAHNRTTIGGLVSRDFTGGYGPEEYAVRTAMTGTYKIMANYYGSRATQLQGAVTVQVDVFTNFGRDSQKRKSLTLRLKEAKETVPIGQIEF